MRRTVALSVVLSVGCVPLPDETSDASTDGGREHFGDVRAIDVPARTCDGGTCTEPAFSEPLGEAACCLPFGQCGLASNVLGTECLPRHAAGGVDINCPGRNLPGGFSIQGCCTPAGRCGLFDPTGELGCIGYAADAATCEFDAKNDCTSIVELPCDGPEDCDDGKVCCGRVQRGRYDLFGCFPACDALIDGQSGVWVEICHPGASCTDPRFTCERSALLPPSFARCHVVESSAEPDAGRSSGDASLEGSSPEASPILDASENAESAAEGTPGVACGLMTCTAGQKCCTRTHEPNAETGPPFTDSYCGKPDVACACSPDADK